MLRLVKSATFCLRQLARGNRRFARRLNKTFEPPMEHKRRLKTVLDRNIKELDKEDNDAESNINDFMAATSWTMDSSIDSDQIEISKLVNKTLIKIKFMPRKETIIQRESVSNDPDDEEDNSEEFDSIKCMIILDKGHTSKLLIEAEVFDGDFSIISVVLDEDTESKSANRFTWNFHYLGPDFETLSESMQTSVVEYMDSLGIDEELAAFIEECTDYHKSQQVKNLLNKFKEFLE